MAKPLDDLRRRRVEMKLTLDGLAKRVGASKASLSKIESGQQIPRLELVARMIEVTGLHLSQLRPDIGEAMRRENTGSAP